jgi:transaldolase
VLAEIGKAGVDIDALAIKLQLDGAQSFVKSWKHLLQGLVQKAQKAQTADGKTPA